MIPLPEQMNYFFTPEKTTEYVKFPKLEAASEAEFLERLKESRLSFNREQRKEFDRLYGDKPLDRVDRDSPAVLINAATCQLTDPKERGDFSVDALITVPSSDRQEFITAIAEALNASDKELIKSKEFFIDRVVFASREIVKNLSPRYQTVFEYNFGTPAWGSPLIILVVLQIIIDFILKDDKV